MNIFSKAKIFVETYLLQRTGVPIQDAIETKLSILDARAPEERKPFSHSVQNDGALVRTELDQSEPALLDEPVLRDRMGNSYADRNQQKASTTLEEISRHEMQIRDLSDSLQEHAEKRVELLQNTPDYHYAKSEAFRNRLIFYVVGLGEIGAMFVLFADFFGIDPRRITSEATKHPVSVIATLFFTIGFFVATLRIAKQVLISNHKKFWAACLLGIAVLVGQMRAIQANAHLETDMNMWFMTLLYTVIGIILPLAAAYYGRNGEEASQVAGSTDSVQRRLDEQAAEYTTRIEEANQARTQSLERIDQLTNEYVTHYQKALMQREQSKRDWEAHQRHVEAYVSQMRYFYNFWTGWNARGMTMPKLLKSGLQATALILLVLIVTLSSCHKAHAEDQFNLLAVCDRSSSAGGISCTADALNNAGTYWIRKADDAGGGIFELFLIDQGFDTAIILFSAEYPEKFPGPVSSHKKKWRNDFIQRLTDVTKSLPTNKGSAVVEAIYRASIRMPDRGENLLYILSDMRQQNKDFNFEKTVPTDKEFLRWLDKSSIKPAFKASTSIIACGIHPYTPDQTSRMTTNNYDRLLKLWRAVFTQWGVKATITEACSLKTTE
ncbi:MAG: hypothetical protein HZB31_04520 [Nitrospirae bacterium]|nr:hypothetical protein [Nitrospirota bacterium]